MIEFVADASAVLAFARGEKGERQVGRVREQCVVSTLNLLEAFSKLVRYDMPADRVRLFLRESFPRVVPLDRELSETSAVLHAATRGLGLSYADCVWRLCSASWKRPNRSNRTIASGFMAIV